MNHQSWLSQFFAWQELLTWSQALRFVAGLCVVSCLVVCGTDWLVRKMSAWRERRAIRMRTWQQRREAVQRVIDAQRERENRVAMRVWRDRVQSNRESKQFHVPAAFRDFKGVQK